jgi:hypothetical protein
MLLVVVSLLNAAATVVYVNKQQTTDEDYKALQARNASNERDLEVATDDASTARSQLTSEEQLAASDAAARQTALDKANAEVASKDADNKALFRNSQTQEANVQGLTAQLAISLESNKQQGQMLSDVRDANAKLVQAQAENDAALSRQRELAETYGRQVEYLGEQLKKSQDLVKAYSSVITQNHLTIPTEQQAAYSGPPVSGVVQDKQEINGVTYLTISVGSSDSVQPGMEFRVVDSDADPHQFLGILTITQADSNTAIGRLQAAAESVGRVKKGNEVTTEIQ